MSSEGLRARRGRRRLRKAITRRTLLQRAAGLGLVASTLGALDLAALMPARALAAAASKLPEQDLEQFYGRPTETYVRRVASMFASNPLPSQGNADQFTGRHGLPA